jgi:hypothetical protein
MEGGVESAVENPEPLTGAVADESCDGVAVHGMPRQRTQHKDVERSLEQIEIW